MDLVERARAFAADAYGSDAELEHPAEVAELVKGAGFGAPVVAAAWLHDLVEDTDVEAAAVQAELGTEVAALVATMTEDESIDGYGARKDEHRRRAVAAGDAAAALFVADKLSNARRMRAGAKQPDARKVGHYAATLELMQALHPALPLLRELERELDGLRADLRRSPA